MLYIISSKMCCAVLQILQVFESCGGELGPDQFQEFSLPYLKDIAYRTKEKLQEAGVEPVPMVNTATIICSCIAHNLYSIVYNLYCFSVFHVQD